MINYIHNFDAIMLMICVTQQVLALYSQFVQSLGTIYDLKKEKQKEMKYAFHMFS